ncbi:unnamed protein product, partial [marine sediment metagenome]
VIKAIEFTCAQFKPLFLEHHQIIAVHYLGAVVMAKEGGNLPGVCPFQNVNII